MVLHRRSVLLVPAWLAACADDPPPRTFQPLRYDYLPPLRLNVQEIAFSALPEPGQLDAVAPVSISESLRQLLEDRLSAAGSSGRALAIIEEARIDRGPDSLDGRMSVRLAITSANGRQAGFAQARVSRHRTGIGRDGRGAMYDMTKEMLDAMNVELEFQIRASLRDTLQSTSTAPAPAPVESQDLAPPKPVP